MGIIIMKRKFATSFSYFCLFFRNLVSVMGSPIQPAISAIHYCWQTIKLRRSKPLAPSTLDHNLLRVWGQVFHSYFNHWVEEQMSRNVLWEYNVKRLWSFHDRYLKIINRESKHPKAIQKIINVNSTSACKPERKSIDNEICEIFQGYFVLQSH